MKKKVTKATNAIESARPTSVWGYKGVPGKGGKTHNAAIVEKKIENETEKESN